MDGERQGAAAVVGHLHSQRPQRVDDGAHRPHPGAWVPVEPDVAAGEGGDRGDEPHDGACQAAVDVRRAVQRAGPDRPVAVAGIVGHIDDLGAEAA
ncbi:MAG: hypothetical protein EPO13_09810 [Actinomycetota bacterium]|nr:MAG: hypothetical protein EPO13_09810 [Actinomycetota bacterium]